MNIRRAISNDAVVLAKVHIDSWRIAYRGIVPEYHLNSLDYEKRSYCLREALGKDLEEIYLAEQDGEVLGFVTLGGCRDADVDPKKTGEIWGIYLAPEHWRKGIGGLLYRYSEKILRLRGYVEVILWVFAANERARRFYERMDFQTDSASKILNPGTPLEAIRYRKDLLEE